MISEEAQITTPRFKDELPSGTVTFLFTDIEGSTELLKQLGDQYAELLAQQRDLLREIFDRWDGQEVDTQGDSFFYSFPRATQAVSAAVEVQRECCKHEWPDGVELRVRMGLHTGEPVTWEEGYVGMDVHRAARITAVGHGGQVLLSATTTPLVLDDLPDGVSLLDLGRHRLKDIRRAERILQLVIEGLPSEFPPLNSLEALPPDLPLDLGPVRLPKFLEEDVETPTALFVGRERELEQLGTYLDKALKGEGGIVFVTGGPGRGKTALLDAFVRGAMGDHDDLLVVEGDCSAYTGMGDPYAPFRSALEMLTGDMEARWASGRISPDGAIRLWESMPEVLQILVQNGPDLINTIIPGLRLLGRAREAIEGGGAWMERLATLCGSERETTKATEQRNLFEQYEDILAEVSRSHGLILVLDDMQWGDSASINLLFHLARYLPGKRLLVLVAYRPEEIALERKGDPHPLKPVLAELKRQYGGVWIDLGLLDVEESMAFVDSYLDSEQNRLSEVFRSALFMHTRGHPLFTVELLRNLQERGDLVRDEDGYWVVRSELDWGILPARVEGVIEERIGRLTEALRETLSIASVEGEEFTAQVVARVQRVGETKLIKRLSRELEKKHRLVRAQDETRVGEHYLSQYRFNHLLFQRYLYNDLSPAERRTMHGEVGRVLEELYAGETEGITVQLANHYTEAREADKAIEYLQGAGDRARMIFANEEAIQFYERALAFQKEKGYDDQAARTLMKLGLTHHSSFDFSSAGKAWEEGLSLWQEASLRESISPLPSAPHALRMQADDPITLDPNKADGGSAMFILQIFSGLVEASPDNSVIPDIAQSWEILEGGTTYQFHLREDARWSDGAPVASGDFEYSWKRALEIDTSNIPEYFYDIKGARAFHQGDLSDPDLIGVRSLDERTLQVELEQPASYFLHLLTNCVTFPVPRHVVERSGEAWTEVGNIVTNGPFRLESWQRDESMVLTRNEDFHGRFAGNLKRVKIQFSHFGDVGNLEAYEAEELDVIDGRVLFWGEMERLVGRFSGEFVASPILATLCFCFDTTRPPFNDSRVRKAIAMATDRVEGWKAIPPEAGHNSLSATGGFVPPGIPGHSPGISMAHNPQEAKKLLADAGYPEGRNFPIIEFIHWNINEVLNSRTERTWSSQWKEILGIESKWEFLEWKSYMKRVKTNRPMMFSLMWHADYPDPDNFLRLGLPKEMGWQNDAFEALIEQSKGSMDQNERLTLLREADKILMEEAPIIPLFYLGELDLVKPWVRRYFPSWKYIIIDPH